MKRWMRAIPVLAFALLLAVAGNIPSAKAAGQESETIPQGIYIDDVNVSGMTAAEAEAAVADYIDDISNQTIKLTANDKVLETTLNELGIKGSAEESVKQALNYGKTGNLISRYKVTKDLEHNNISLPVTLEVDRDAATAYLEANDSQINQEAKDYSLELNSSGGMDVVEGEEGVEVNRDASVEAIADYFSDGWQDNPTIALATEITEPKGSAEELAQVKDVLGSYTTNYASSTSNRAQNVYNGCSKINGTVVYPGDTFSVYNAVAPFDEENGYALAGSYENGTTVETYGGGICQVSTTLYNAVIRAELQVDERYGHAMTVSYVDPSADAAISGTTQDFKFTNNTDAPIYIAGWANGAEISFVIYGHETRPSNRVVSFESETYETEDYTTKYEADYEQPIGYFMQTQTPHQGVSAQLWKVVTVDGVEESREVFNYTNYMMSPLIYSVGVATDNTDAANAMYTAISTQDYTTIQTAVYAYAAYGKVDYSATSDTSSAGTSTATDDSWMSSGTTAGQ